MSNSPDDVCAAFTSQVTDRIRELATAMPNPVRDLIGRPGKQVRPLLVRACAAGGPADPWRLVRCGALVELLHLASLIHDDVVDRSDIRRGGPAVHRRMGEEHAMLAGLNCFAIAGKEAAELGGGLEKLVGQTVADLAYGEILDIERAFDTALPLPTYLELLERKTGALFRLACIIGAVESGASADVVEALGRFGSDLGVAFQVLDDCLDFNAATSGKPAGTDHLLGLFGAPTLHALADDTSGRLATMLLSPSFQRTDMAQVRDLVDANGGLEAAVRLARHCHDRALAHLDGLDPRTRDAVIEVTSTVWRDLP